MPSKKSKKSPLERLNESAPVDRKDTPEELARHNDIAGLIQEWKGQMIVEQAKKNAKEDRDNTGRNDNYNVPYSKIFRGSIFGDPIDKDIREKAAEDAILKHKWRN